MTTTKQPAHLKAYWAKPSNRRRQGRITKKWFSCSKNKRSHRKAMAEACDF